MTRARAALRARTSAVGSDAGFTVLEVLVAFVLFVLTSTTATYAIFNAINASHLSQQRVDAAGVAQSFIAQATANTNTIGPETAKSYSASVLGESFAVQRTIAFFTAAGSALPTATQCAQGNFFKINVIVNQAQSGKFLARTDSLVACP